MRHSDAVGGAGAGQADQVLGADVGCKDGCADNEPAEVAAGKEVIIGRVFAFQAATPRI
ncbi:MAG: hypothetical protein ACYSR4_05500 [Planctomycetota bacterium]